MLEHKLILRVCLLVCVPRSRSRSPFLIPAQVHSRCDDVSRGWHDCAAAARVHGPPRDSKPLVLDSHFGEHQGVCVCVRVISVVRERERGREGERREGGGRQTEKYTITTLTQHSHNSCACMCSCGWKMFNRGSRVKRRTKK